MIEIWLTLSNNQTVSTQVIRFTLMNHQMLDQKSKSMDWIESDQNRENKYVIRIILIWWHFKPQKVCLSEIIWFHCFEACEEWAYWPTRIKYELRCHFFLSLPMKDFIFSDKIFQVLNI